MRKFCFVILLLISTTVYSQHSFTIVLNDLSAQKAANVFITGDFNGWNPGEAKYNLKKLYSNKWEITFKNIPNGTFNYKFTQGKWDTEEVTASGENVGNHTLQIENDYALQVNIYGWKNSPSQPKKHTAGIYVHKVADSFYIPQLGRYRKIAVYLPSNYNNTKEKYPVLYMHDGQNLFDEFYAPFGEWGIDEALDTLQKQTGKYAILVAIDHGNEKRITEYNFEDNKKYGAEEGVKYVDFLVTTLKPFIDKKYRTQKDKSHTAIAGSSLGGLISTYAVIKYPKIFGTAGIFSPAYWIAPTIDSLSIVTSKKTANRYWFYAGEKESSDMVNDMKIVKDNVAKNMKNDISYNIDMNGAHNENTWRKWFPAFYLWWVNAFK